jgi:dTDP-glucose pyrophosphorylase
MINILIPLAGPHQFFSESKYIYPKPLIEIQGKTMIEHVIENFKSIKEKNFIFILNNEDCKKHHLDNVLNLLTKDRCQIIKINGETKGAACSALMAIEHINNTSPLIITNADQLFEDELETLITQFKDADAGVISFNSVHPRWSYAKLDKKENIIETSEKRPISNHAIAGFFYFKEGRSFIKSAMRMIEKDANFRGNFYISPTLNEMVLENKKLRIVSVDNKRYHTFYTPKKIDDYEKLKCQDIREIH